MYPTKYRAVYMGVAIWPNWGFTFPIAFFIPFIKGAIGFAYGYDLTGCYLAAIFVDYFFLKRGTIALEEIDNMYLLRVRSGVSGTWAHPHGTSSDRSQIDHQPLEKDRQWQSYDKKKFDS
jgi:SP family sugar:H+ symporter-like MFS transporter